MNLLVVGRMERGGDGLLSVHTQEFPRLMELIDPSSDESGSSEKCERLPSVLRRGRWYYMHRNHSHISPAFACRDTWTLIWTSCQAIHASSRVRTEEEGGTEGRVREAVASEAVVKGEQPWSRHAEVALRSCCLRPDMQTVYLSVEKRPFRYHLGIQAIRRISSSTVLCPVTCGIFLFHWFKNSEALLYSGIGTIAASVMSSALLLKPEEGRKESFAWSSESLDLVFIASRAACLLWGDEKTAVCWPIVIVFESLLESLCPHISYRSHSVSWLKLAMAAVTQFAFANLPSNEYNWIVRAIFVHYSFLTFLSIAGWFLLGVFEKKSVYYKYCSLTTLSNIALIFHLLSCGITGTIILFLFPFVHNSVHWRVHSLVAVVTSYALTKVHQDVSEIFQYVSILAYYNKYN